MKDKIDKKFLVKCINLGLNDAQIASQTGIDRRDIEEALIRFKLKKRIKPKEKIWFIG